jgi:tetraacyldisaccharide 4'-kinase
MDDGLSSPSIKHFMSFLLFDNLRFSGNDRFLPFGPKRIPLFLLKKLISMIVATNIDNQTINSDIKDLSQNYFNLSSTCSTEIITECNIDENDKFLAFSGLGINEKFFFSLRKHGVNLIKTIEFPDHHFYEIDDLNKISEIAKKFNINRIITTSKDFVKLPKQWIEKNGIVEFKILHESNDLEKFILNKINI